MREEYREEHGEEYREEHEWGWLQDHQQLPAEYMAELEESDDRLPAPS